MSLSWKFCIWMPDVIAGDMEVRMQSSGWRCRLIMNKIKNEETSRFIWTEPPNPHWPPKSPTQRELSVLAPGSCVWVANNGSLSIRLNKTEKPCSKFSKMSWKCLYNPFLKISVLKPIVNVNYRNPLAHHLSGHTKLWILTQSPRIYFWLTYFFIIFRRGINDA